MTATTKKNKGFITEESHYNVLSNSFGIDAVSKPKGAAGGSDFVVSYNDQIVTFESKSHHKDMFDAGVLNLYSNGCIFYASSFLTNTHISQIETAIKVNLDQILNYTKLANTNVIPHTINKTLYNDIKAAGKLINIVVKEPLQNIIEDSFIQSKNKFCKANYIIIDKHIYCVSDKPHLDPLNLRDHGAAVLSDECIDNYTIRLTRNGTKNNVATASIRVYFKLKSEIPKTRVVLNT